MSPRPTSSVGSHTEPCSSVSSPGRKASCAAGGGDKGEFGATTGRPRRVGWFDAVATQVWLHGPGSHSGGPDLSGRAGPYLDEIRVCVGETTVVVTDEFPCHPLGLLQAKPVFETPARLEVRRAGRHRL